MATAIQNLEDFYVQTAIVITTTVFCCNVILSFSLGLSKYCKIDAL